MRWYSTNSLYSVVMVVGPCWSELKWSITNRSIQLESNEQGTFYSVKPLDSLWKISVNERKKHIFSDAGWEVTQWLNLLLTLTFFYPFLCPCSICCCSNSAALAEFELAHNLSSFGKDFVKCTVLQRYCDRALESVRNARVRMADVSQQHHCFMHYPC